MTSFVDTLKERNAFGLCVCIALASTTWPFSNKKNDINRTLFDAFDLCMNGELSINFCHNCKHMQFIATCLNPSLKFFLFLHPQMLTRCRYMNRNFKGNEYFSIHRLQFFTFNLFTFFWCFSISHKISLSTFFNIHLLQWQKWWFEFLDWLTCFQSAFCVFSGLYWHLFLKILNE